ncbi:MAG: hypothetical protein HYR81_05000 [Nitrospirae bacterium]|nr:hypothetical protein [Nitrospirota bacterium]
MMKLNLKNKKVKTFLLGLVILFSVMGLSACFPARTSLLLDYRYPGPHSAYPDYYYYDHYYGPFYYTPYYYGSYYYSPYYYPGYNYGNKPYYAPPAPGRRMIK